MQARLEKSHFANHKGRKNKKQKKLSHTLNEQTRTVGAPSDDQHFNPGTV